jgi:hypothetical protein
MTAIQLQSSVTVKKVEPICDIIKSLEAISCDSCQGKMASYDVYLDSGIANIPFLKKYCTECIQKVAN